MSAASSVPVEGKRSGSILYQNVNTVTVSRSNLQLIFSFHWFHTWAYTYQRLQWLQPAFSSDAKIIWNWMMIWNWTQNDWRHFRASRTNFNHVADEFISINLLRSVESRAIFNSTPPPWYALAKMKKTAPFHKVALSKGLVFRRATENEDLICFWWLKHSTGSSSW